MNKVRANRRARRERRKAKKQVVPTPTATRRYSPKARSLDNAFRNAFKGIVVMSPEERYERRYGYRSGHQSWDQKRRRRAAQERHEQAKAAAAG